MSAEYMRCGCKPDDDAAAEAFYYRAGGDKLPKDMMFKVACAIYADKTGIEPLVTDADITVAEPAAALTDAALAKHGAPPGTPERDDGADGISR